MWKLGGGIWIFLRNSVTVCDVIIFFWPKEDESDHEEAVVWAETRDEQHSIFHIFPNDSS